MTGRNIELLAAGNQLAIEHILARTIAALQEQGILDETVLGGSDAHQGTVIDKLAPDMVAGYQAAFHRISSDVALHRTRLRNMK